MNRSPEEILKSILANLTMARDAEIHDANRSKGDAAVYMTGRASAFTEAINLIKTEANLP